MLQSNSKKVLKGKDLITIGIFSAIYFVINFIFMLMGGLHPLMWILMPGFIALFSGIPFMLMCAKVQKFGSVLLMGLITGLIYFVTGQFTVIILVTFVIACGLGELFRALTGYGSFLGNTAAFVCFSLGMTGSPLPVWLMRDEFLAQIAEQGMPEDYIATLEAVSSPTMLIVLIAAPIVGAVIGAVITKAMFKKHFEKAGIV
ncbi:MAG: MptD family putative ECF transporter S component [Roseburia sp.]|nr:MptD family putative ECF transporter S component [Roseburia sp.]